MPASAATIVTLTGTGIPHATPGRAGAGVLVRHGDVALQFDAGRGTVIRLAEAGCEPHALDAVLLTHVHSDHVVDLADVAMTRWIQRQLHACGALTILAVEGEATRFVARMLEPYDDDIASRMAHVQADAPQLDLRSYPLPVTPTEVWRSGDGDVLVEAVGVHHEPIREAVAYRVTTPTGVVVISGDTRVCDEVEDLSRGADVLVHEACRTTAMRDLIAGSVFERIFSYHADTVALGGLAERAGVPHVVLTHLIPSPTTPDEEAAFEQDLRDGGYTGHVTVGRDLVTVELGR